MAPGQQSFPEDLPADFLGQAQRGGVDGWQDQLRHWTRSALQSGQSELMSRAREDMEGVLFDVALELTGGKRIEAARLLGVGRNTLTRKLKERQA